MFLYLAMCFWAVQQESFDNLTLKINNAIVSKRREILAIDAALLLRILESRSVIARISGSTAHRNASSDDELNNKMQ